MHRISILLVAVFFLTTAPITSFAAMELYSGTIRIIKSSGKACEGFKSEHAVEMLLERGKVTPRISGYFAGEGLATGRFSGDDASHLEVRYPYVEESKASGHFIKIAADGVSVQAELHDRHIEETAEDCNFDLARLELRRVNDDKLTENRFKQIAGLYDAQLMRSQASVLVQEGLNAEAIVLYEKALALVDSVANKDPDMIAPYLSSLATAYIRAGRFKDFNRLYDVRIDSIKDEPLRAFFLGHRIRALLNEGKAALVREDYDGALIKFQQAYQLHPQGKDIMAAIMAAYVRAGRYDDAIAFLEKALKTLDNDNDRSDVSEAIALVYYEKAKKAEKKENDPEAEASLRKAEQLAPDNFHYLVALARLRHKMGSLDEAEKILDSGLRRFKDEAIRKEIIAARDRMRLTESILKKIRKAGS
ncbi:MAG: hypothetical protein CXR30_01350 [Geobacter sp.]|nr:MAG: hypothetical protein CXR30_01350 [Geobacter sp.]